MEKDLIQVSVVVPTFNRKILLARALQSVFSQDLPPYEIIVIDDGSTDGTMEFLARNFPHVNYVYQENAGVSAARNQGIKLAMGNWIAFLDSDDAWAPTKLREQVAIIEAQPDLMWISGALGRLSKDGESINESASEVASFVGSCGAQSIAFFEPLGNTQKCHTSATMVRKSVFHEVGFFKEGLNFGEHLEMWFRIAFRYPELGYVSSICAIKYPGSANSLSVGQDRGQTIHLFNSLSKELETAPKWMRRRVQRWISICAAMQIFKQIQYRGSQKGLPEELISLVPRPWVLVSSILCLAPTKVRKRASRMISDQLRSSL
jgi:glycosyltransferase involved in cell wall biosynthesis